MAGRFLDSPTIRYVASADVLAGADVEIRTAEVSRDLTYHPGLFSQSVLDEKLCRAKGHDVPSRLQIPPTSTPPWNTMILRDTSPTPADPPDAEVAPNRLAEIQLFCPVDNHPDNTMLVNGGVRFDVPLRGPDRLRMDAVVADSLGRIWRADDVYVAIPGVDHALLQQVSPCHTSDAVNAANSMLRITNHSATRINHNRVWPSGIVAVTARVAALILGLPRRRGDRWSRPPTRRGRRRRCR